MAEFQYSPSEGKGTKPDMGTVHSKYIGQGRSSGASTIKKLAGRLI